MVTERNNRLMGEVRRVHYPNYTCRVCGEGFHNYASLENHFNNNH